MRGSKGVSLIEILIGIIIVVIASIGTLTYFSSALGNVGKQGNRRAALERARERLEVLLASNLDTSTGVNGIKQDKPYWVSCSGVGNPCPRTLSDASMASSAVTETVSVDNLATQKIETTLKWIDDPAINSDDPPAPATPTPDVLELGVKVWFTANTSADDNFNRVYLRTLSTP